MYGIVAGIGCQSMELNHTHTRNERTNERTNRKKCQYMIWEVFVKIYTKFIHRWEPWDFFLQRLKHSAVFFLSLQRSHAIVEFFFLLLLFEWISTFSFTNWTESETKKKRYIRNTLIGFLAARWIPLISIYIQTISELDIRDKRLCCCSEQVTYDIFLFSFFCIFFSSSFLFFIFILDICRHHIALSHWYSHAHQL